MLTGLFFISTISCKHEDFEPPSDKTPPASATAFTATPMDSKILLKWENPADEDFCGVEVFAEPNEGSLENAVVLLNGANSFLASGLSNGKEYTFKIRAFDKSGNFSESVLCTASPIDTSDQTPPAPATEFTAVAMDGAAYLFWDDALDSDIFGYELSWAQNSALARLAVATKNNTIFVPQSESGKNEIAIFDLQNDAECTFTLKTLDKSGNKSEEVFAKCTPQKIAEAKNLTAIFFDGKTHISFANPNNYEKAEIFSEGKLIGEVENSSSKVYGNYFYFVDENATAQKCYIVKTKNAAGQASEGVATFAFATELPVIEIQTEGAADVLSKEEYVKMSISVWDGKNAANCFSKTDFADGIRRRGNSTFGYPKKPYRIKFNKKTSLFGLEKAKSWVLLANYIDPTLIMNDVTFKLGRTVELPFTNNGFFVDLILNGKYLGTYYLTEQVQVGKGRVDIDEKEGILSELDVYMDEDPKFYTQNYRLPVMFKNPEVAGDDISLLENEVALFNALDAAVYNGGAADVSENLWTEIADVSTFAKFLLCNTIVKNGELGHPKSTYIYREKDGKFSMGPLWDFNWAFGYKGSGRTYFVSGSENGDVGRCAFFQKIYSDETFKAEYKKVWNQYKTEIEKIADYMEEQKTLLAKSAELNRTVWGFSEDTFAQIDAMKAWWTSRLSWMNTAVVGM